MHLNYQTHPSYNEENTDSLDQNTIDPKITDLKSLLFQNDIEQFREDIPLLINLLQSIKTVNDEINKTFEDTKYSTADVQKQKFWEEMQEYFVSFVEFLSSEKYSLSPQELNLIKICVLKNVLYKPEIFQLFCKILDIPEEIISISSDIQKICVYFSSIQNQHNKNDNCRWSHAHGNTYIKNPHILTLATITKKIINMARSKSIYRSLSSPSFSLQQDIRFAIQEVTVISDTCARIHTGNTENIVTIAESFDPTSYKRDFIHQDNWHLIRPNIITPAQREQYIGVDKEDIFRLLDPSGKELKMFFMRGTHNPEHIKNCVVHGTVNSEQGRELVNLSINSPCFTGKAAHQAYIQEIENLDDHTCLSHFGITSKKLSEFFRTQFEFGFMCNLKKDIPLENRILINRILFFLKSQKETPNIPSHITNCWSKGDILLFEGYWRCPDYYYYTEEISAVKFSPQRILLHIPMKNDQVQWDKIQGVPDWDQYFKIKPLTGYRKGAVIYLTEKLLQS